MLRNLSMVCHFWHGLIKKSPPLWTKIDLNVHGPNTYPVDVKAERWLERTGNCPLVLKIDCTSHGSTALSEGEEAHGDTTIASQLVRLIELLQRCMGRWRELTIMASLSELHAFFGACTGRAPQLRTLSAHVVGSWSAQDASLPLLMHLPFDRHPESDPSMELSFDGGFPIFKPPFGLGLSIHIEGVTNLSYLLRHVIVPSLQSLKLYNFIWGPELFSFLWDILIAHGDLHTVEWEGNPSKFEVPTYGVPTTSLDPSRAVVLPKIVAFKLYYAPCAHQLIRQLVLSHVQHLFLHNLPIDSTLRLISSSDAITSATISRIPPAEESRLSSAPVSIPTLESLALYFECIDLLDDLDTPGLTSLTLANAQGHRSPLFSISRFIQRSNPPLLFLDLKGTVMNDAELIRCFGMLPSLKKLRLFSCWVSNAVLRALSEQVGENGSTAPRFLPRLEFVWIEYMPRLAAAAIVQFFVSRSSVSLAGTSCIMQGHVVGQGIDERDISTLQSIGVDTDDWS
ncbi:hypothetical protein BOTBODRAFT_172469 [Botryobasidium botryosum FD-172 SS1]|uniref:F-box domain-containing protein n=1 Tax=Botryobasidium botryosum (strain FD-172 SS1) TaxID=930990 RepID=A0A067MRV0_BOTB1|nr:hypothetical protein BOTBODRAFT_172469 [Botryobasidium botryosum FD-172 SS1]